MDFSGKVGRIMDQQQGQATGNGTSHGAGANGYKSDGYAYFRRKVVSPKDVEPYLTESQTRAHIDQPWFHRGVGRELANRILTATCSGVDGAFLVRESSVAGGYVVSYIFGSKCYHAQALPGQSNGQAYFSVDDGKTRFYDLLQLVEFYQLNQGSLNSRLGHCVVRKEVVDHPKSDKAAVEADGDSTSTASMSSQKDCEKEKPIAAAATNGNNANGDTDSAKMDTNHNEDKTSKDDNEAAMNSAGEDESGDNASREFPQRG